ncbi:hypothetical protein HYH02_013992 [Chlamydomonas schloesseri]|uniref:Methyltransferase FkbM domain-containing protein n=1 Tax=Chlamydomonas schloesseri TaxID=2026947 RepID=A0A835SM80_9CHLO|nr:hypothetical protein HYH02_013992 [Chlamydomonas schloesseri]|eukprot:KAG2429653.1 hypothetical protein HYH02_013992 [Chlamydomonas schloesseri]
MQKAASQAAYQADLFLARLNESGIIYTSCARHHWLEKLAVLGQSSSGLATIIDIGCNRGYFTSTALNYWAPGFGNHNQLVFKEHNAGGQYGGGACGICNDCNHGPTQPLTHLQPQAEVDVHCFEPSQWHQKALTAMRAAVYGPVEAPKTDKGTAVRWHILPHAVSNATGTARFPTSCIHEECNFDLRNEAMSDVNVTSIDAYLKQARIRYVDVLKIDTEGFDPAVLAGAYNTLRRHLAEVLSFEYHAFWYRSGGTLRMCLDYLEELGYTCYYDAPLLYKLTGCWDPRYEIKKWSNIVCAVRGSEIEGEMNALTVLRQQRTAAHEAHER